MLKKIIINIILMVIMSNCHNYHSKIIFLILKGPHNSKIR